MFDPWTATFEQAKQANDEWITSGGEIASPLCPIAQAGGAQRILGLKEEIDGGDGYAVLLAIRICVTNGLVAPEWLAYAFNRRYDAVNWCRAKSWDDPLAFGAPYPKGTNIAARRKARIGRIAVWDAIRKKFAATPDTAIDKGLFECVGKELGFGATLTEEFYYQAKKMFGEPVWIKRHPANSKKAAGLRKKVR